MEKRFTPKFFYIKKTWKYRYVGQTTGDVYKTYHGSGVKWTKHLKKEGIKKPENEVVFWCESPEDFQKYLDYYVPSDYVNSKEWANLVAETPWDGTDSHEENFDHSSEFQSYASLSRWNDPDKREHGLTQLASLRTEAHQRTASLAAWSNQETREILLDHLESIRTPEHQRAASSKSSKFKGKNHSEETRRKIGQAAVGTKKPIVTCPHCGKSGGSTGMAVSHFDKCKFKLN